MSDETIRALQRAWEASGLSGDFAAWLNARERAGEPVKAIRYLMFPDPEKLASTGENRALFRTKLTQLAQAEIAAGKWIIDAPLLRTKGRHESIPIPRGVIITKLEPTDGGWGRAWWMTNTIECEHAMKSFSGGFGGPSRKIQLEAWWDLPGSKATPGEQPIWTPKIMRI